MRSSCPSILLALALAFPPVFAPRAVGQDANASGSKRSFDPSKLDARRWQIPPDLRVKITAHIALGKQFFSGSGRQALIEALRRLETEREERIQIGWVLPADGRSLGTWLSHTLEQLEAMSETEFETYRRNWSVSRELERRRFHPLPTELRGYGGAKEREELLEKLRLLIEARSKTVFLEATRDRVRGGYLSLLSVPKGGHGPTCYSISTTAVASLSEEEFQLWRQRFLHWIEIHTPGQSRVRLFATASSEEFETLYATSKDRHGHNNISPGLERFEQQCGIRLAYPHFTKGQTHAVIERINPQSTAVPSPLQEGDLVLEVEGQAVSEWDDFIYQLGAYSPGSIVAIRVRSKADGAQAAKVGVRYLRIPEPVK